MATIRDYIPKIRESFKELGSKAIEVGVFGGEQAWLAHIHEYGCIIQVTPKMRAYLKATGLALKPSTITITIPERAFLRNGYDKGKNEALSAYMDFISALITGNIDADTILEALGTNLEGKIKEYATNQVEPPLHPYTIEHRQHGGSNPLNDTGSMIGAISHRIVGK